VAASTCLPLAVAVTGHRDIAPDDEASLRDLIRDRLATLRRTYPFTPLLALSGLAEGADMVFAEAALELGIELVAVLPANPDVFARNFRQPAHPKRDPAALAQRFTALCQCCSDTVVVADGRLADDPRRYTFVGAYLVRRCHLLFALWDGEAGEPESGTALVVRLAREGVPNRLRTSPGRVLETPDPVPVHHLCTPRQGAPLPGAFTWEVLRPAAGASPCDPVREPEPLAALEAWNAAATAFDAASPEASAQSRRWLALPEASLTPAEKRILGAYSLADAMAVTLQRRSRRILDAIYVLSAVMLLGFAIHSNVMASRLLYVSYFAAFAVGSLLYFCDRAKRHHHRFVDSRGLAEGLRVQLFFRLAGVHSLAADLYLRKQRTELAWMRQAMRVLEVGSRRTRPLFEPVRDSWIRAQAAYYTSARQRDAGKLAWYERGAKIGFLGGLGIGVLGLLVELPSPTMHDSLFIHWVFLFMGVLPGLAALAVSHAFRRGLGEHVREYAQNGAMFCRASSLVESESLLGKPFAFRLLVLELGKEALAENAQWVLRHRELSPDLPSK
jgi:hypothetical protein